MSAGNLSPMENGATPLASGRPPIKPWQLALMGGAAVAVLVGGHAAWRAFAPPPAPKQEAAPMVAMGGGQPFHPQALPAPAPKIVPAVFNPGVVVPQAPPPQPYVPAFVAHAAPAVGEKNGPTLRLAGGNSQAAPPAPTRTAAEGDGPQIVGGGASSALGERLKPTLMEGSRATLLHHPELTITMGTVIPCIQDTAIQSDLPGFVRCTVPTDIRGSAGHVILLPKGTRIVGQLQQTVMQGQSRVFVLWTRAETPEHVIVNLDSPATDALGRSGLDGDINTHFFQRFGGALMLSFIDSGLQAAALAASRSAGGNTTLFQMQGGQSAAGEALRNTINIAPTITRNEGTEDAVFVARDLSFEGVYRLRVAQ